MTGRLLGEVYLPPENKSDWDLAQSTIYGCPLCYLINSQQSHDHSQLLNNFGHPINFEFKHHTKHGLSIQLSDVPSGTYTISASMGHIYFRPLENFKPSKYKIVEADKITLLKEDQPAYELYVHQGKFYNSYADIVVGVEAEQVLIGLTKEHHKLVQLGLHADQYEQMRNEFIKILDEYLIPYSIKLDTEYGQRAIKMIVKNLDFNLPHSARLRRIKVRSAFGKIYLSELPIDRVIFKYQKLNLRHQRRVWNSEMRSNQMINHNLDTQPNLPYPYTFQIYRCGEMNIDELTEPTCPDGDTVGVFIQEYIDYSGSLNYYIARYPNQSLDYLFEAMAVLAEAHQGDTVQYHFMHLDAHMGNFLVSECRQDDRICSISNSRTVDFGGFKYKFDRHGVRIYLIDFGFSHFLDGEPKRPLNSDLPSDVQLTDDLYPAYDFITLYRSAMYGAVSSIINDDVDEEYQRLIMAMKIGAAMIGYQIRELASRRVLYEEDDLRDISYKPLDKVPILNVEEVARFIYDLTDDELQPTLIKLVDKYMKTVIRGLSGRKVSLASQVLNILVGIYQQKDENFTYVDRNIYIEELEPLSAESLRLLGITEPVPNLTGIPLYLWYMKSAGVLGASDLSDDENDSTVGSPDLDDNYDWDLYE